jgi:hypothetical protein
LSAFNIVIIMVCVLVSYCGLYLHFPYLMVLALLEIFFIESNSIFSYFKLIEK